jgi:HSP20 family protein
MKSYQALRRLPVIQPNRVLLKPISRKMSLFPRSFISHDPAASFGPLFRLLDDFDQHRGNVDSGRHHHRSGPKMFTPRFDVRELPDHYELNGELPGIEQKDVEIEFIDAQTLTVHGRTEHSYTSGTPPAGFVEGPTSSGAITEGGEGHKATVEDNDEPSKNTTDIAKREDAPAKPEAKYWVSERSVGEFSRSFSFPAGVDQDNVRASMKNGILGIIVPKAKKPESRKITIS